MSPGNQAIAVSAGREERTKDHTRQPREFGTALLGAAITLLVARFSAAC